jgi:hypothetical protein
MTTTSHARGLFLSLLAIAMGTSGCAHLDRYSVTSKQMGHSNTLGTQADVRLVIATPVQQGPPIGRVRPAQVVCAEPSPDVAKAMAAAASMAAGVDLQGKSPEAPVEGAAAGSGAYTQSRAESAAQLTNRLATIQLLRDGLYRACEAYANGAISDTTYAVILSRYDDTMVTMLMGELAAGNFGQQLATLSSDASGNAAATAGKMTESSLETLKEAQAELDQAKEAEKKAAAELKSCRDANAEDPCEAQNTKLSEARRTLTSKQATRDSASMFARNSAATAHSMTQAAATAVGAVARLGGEERTSVAGSLSEMQRKFVENVNADGLIVACVSAMDRRGPDAVATELLRFCKDHLPEILAGGHQALLTKLNSSYRLHALGAKAYVEKRAELEAAAEKKSGKKQDGAGGQSPDEGADPAGGS